jgi:hypothetical protein
MKEMKVVYGAILAGLITILGDIFIRQTIVANTIEKDKVPEVCKQYRKTKSHLFSLFTVGVVVFFVVHYFGLRDI